MGRGALGPRPTFTSGTVILPPGETRSIGLGVYSDGGPQPEFKFTCTPDLDDDMIGASLDRLSIPGGVRYMMLYLFHNYGYKECRIEVRRQDGGHAGATR